MGVPDTIMKIVLVIINLIFFLASGLMLAFGITGKANAKLLGQIFDKILPESAQEDLDKIGVNLRDIVIDNSTFMIIVGIIGLVIAVFGFVGACCMIRWMLVIYAIVLILLLLAEVALIIFAAVYSDKFKDEFQEAMKKSLTNDFEKGIQMNGTQVILPTDAVELAWATVQLKSECCGAYNYSDYSTFKWSKEVIIGTPAKVPLSCCKPKGSVGDLDSIDANSFENVYECLEGNSAYINQQDCFEAVKDKITDFINDYKGIAIGIAAGICGLELILIVFAFCLCARAKGGDDKYV